jgi:hypothetical protein
MQLSGSSSPMMFFGMGPRIRHVITFLVINRMDTLRFQKSKISTEKPFAQEKRLLHFPFVAFQPDVSLALGSTRDFDRP